MFVFFLHPQPDVTPILPSPGADFDEEESNLADENDESINYMLELIEQGYQFTKKIGSGDFVRKT